MEYGQAGRSSWRSLFADSRDISTSFSLGETRTMTEKVDRFGLKMSPSEEQAERDGDKVRDVGLRWIRHIKRRDSEYSGRRMLEMVLPARI